MLLAKYSSDMEIGFLTMFNCIERNEWLQNKSISNNLNNESDDKTLKNDLFQCELCLFNQSCDAISDSNPSVYFVNFSGIFLNN